MLLGNYTSRVTTGNRVAVPKRLRSELGDRFIVAKWYEQCLVCISIEHWEALLQKLTGKQEVLTAAVRDTDRFIMGSAYEIEVDAQGRVLLPESLKSFANLSEDVIFLGLGMRVEIWDKNTWQTKELEIGKTASNLIEKLGNG